MADKSLLLDFPLGKIPPISQARFWKFVDISGGVDACWPWRGSTGLGGYGWFQFDGQHYTATHIALAMDGRGVPKDMHACHHCDNPPCCNPRHLFVGSQRDNLLDRTLKGRATNQFSGARHCRKGHEYTPENTLVQIRKNKPVRHCLSCRRISQDNLNAIDRQKRADAGCLPRASRRR